MDWFMQLRQALPGFYVSGRPPDVAGYLRGNGSPGQWRGMATANPPHHQMLILGNTEPTNEQWIAAGVGQRGGMQFAITRGMLTGFIVLYGGFVMRPWGQIFVESNDALTIGFPAALQNWRNEAAAAARRRP
jgi:hypothetical protein